MNDQNLDVKFKPRVLLCSTEHSHLEEIARKLENIGFLAQYTRDMDTATRLSPQAFAAIVHGSLHDFCVPIKKENPEIRIYLIVREYNSSPRQEGADESYAEGTDEYDGLPDVILQYLESKQHL